jgi:hypothetical protein
VYSDLRDKIDEANRRLHALTVDLRRGDAGEHFILKANSTPEGILS